MHIQNVSLLIKGIVEDLVRGGACLSYEVKIPRILLVSLNKLNPLGLMSNLPFLQYLFNHLSKSFPIFPLLSALLELLLLELLPLYPLDVFLVGRYLLQRLRAAEYLILVLLQLLRHLQPLSTRWYPELPVVHFESFNLLLTIKQT